MGMGLSGGFAAGAGADALETLLSRLFTEGQAKIRTRQAQQQIDQENRRLSMMDADRDEARANAQRVQAQTAGLKLAGTLRPRQEITPGQSSTLATAGMDDKIVAPTLGSRNIGQGLTSTANPGRGESFAGLPEQLEEEAQNEELKRQITVASPALRGRLTMASLLPPDKRATAISEVMREEAKPPERSPALREYQDAVSQGYKGTFEQYQTADANRKRPVVNVTAGQNASNNLAMKLADDYTRDAKDFTTQNAAMRRVSASAKDPSAAGDMALLYAYMKMLDPNSVVRESEFATAAASGSLPQQVQGWVTKVANGQRLTPEQRTDFVNRAQALYNEAKATNATIRKSYEKRAKQFGVDPSLVFTDIEDEAPTPAAGGKGANDPLGIR